MSYIQAKLISPAVCIGAHDGMELSNTAALDRMGWRGICIDPFLKKDGFLQRTCRLSQHAVRHLSLTCLLRLSYPSL